MDVAIDDLLSTWDTTETQTRVQNAARLATNLHYVSYVSANTHIR